MTAGEGLDAWANEELDARSRDGGASWTTYLLHFDRPYKHARHYTGTASDLEARLAEHQAGRGARLLQVAKAAGISWRLARTWPGGRNRERQLKTQGGASRRCPECGVKPHTRADQQKEGTAMRKPKDRSAEPKPGTRPPEYVVVTWVSEQLRDRIQRCGPSLDEALRTTRTPEHSPQPELEAEP